MLNYLSTIWTSLLFLNRNISVRIVSYKEDSNDSINKATKVHEKSYVFFL